MKILLDSCVWGPAKAELATLGHDVVWSGDWPVDPGDEDILRHAFAEQRILVTLDKDFGELAIARQMPHCGILRLVNIAAKQQAGFCHKIVKSHCAELQSGAIITAESWRLRIHSPPAP